MRPHLLLLTVLGSLMSPCTTQATPANQTAPRVAVLDEKGQQISAPGAIYLAPGRIGVPTETFAQLEISITKHDKQGRVYMLVPRSPHEPVSQEGSVMYGFKAGEHQVYNPVSGYRPERYSYPIALNRDGQLYVSVGVVERFLRRFTSRWDKNTRTLTLQRRYASPRVW